MTATLPAGTTTTDWDEIDGRRFRCVDGRSRSRDGVTVKAFAIQLDDGTIDTGVHVEAPQIFVAVPSDGISVGDATALAATLMDAVREVDGWRTHRTGDQQLSQGQPTIHVYYGNEHEIADFVDNLNGDAFVFYRDACTTKASDTNGRPLPDGWVLSLCDGDEWIIGAWDIDGVDTAVSKARDYLAFRQ